MAKNRPVPLKDEPIITMEELHEKINHLGNLLNEIKTILSEKTDNNNEPHEKAAQIDCKAITEVNRNIGKMLVRINAELLSLYGSLGTLENRVSSIEMTINKGFRRLEEKQLRPNRNKNKDRNEKPLRPKSIKGMLGYWLFRLPWFYIRQFITSAYFKRWLVIILLCIWVISICFTCIIAIDNARMHQVNKAMYLHFRM